MTPVQLPEVPALLAARGLKPHLWWKGEWFCWANRRIISIPENLDCDGYGDTPSEAYADLMKNIVAFNTTQPEQNSGR